MIAIIDYGMGNLRSVQKAFEKFCSNVVVSSSAKDILKADKIVLPGVGAFKVAMDELKKRGLIYPIKASIKEGKPFLGICLGLQLLFETSAEDPGVKGLCVLKGESKRFKFKGQGSRVKGQVLKVPHMGWNTLKVKSLNCPLLKGILDQDQVYFCHSYYPLPEDSRVVAACADYGLEFAAVVWKDNVYGAQFHPEKSQAVGLKIIRNFVESC